MKPVEGSPDEIRLAAEAFPENGGGAPKDCAKSAESWNARQRVLQRAFILGFRKAKELAS